jgi:hypothetical protein
LGLLSWLVIFMSNRAYFLATRQFGVIGRNKAEH